MNAWIATTYAASREVLRGDELLFMGKSASTGPDVTFGSDRYNQMVGPRHISLIHGEPHRRWHRWWLASFSPKQVDEWRVTIVDPIINLTLDRFAGAGMAELVEDFAKRVSIRVIAAIMDLPWRDEAWVARCRESIDAQAGLGNTPGVRSEEAFDRCVRGRQEMDSLLDPFIDARRSGAGSDFISLLWRDGPSLFDDWSLDDMRSQSRLGFVAGADSTSNALSNAFYLLMSRGNLRRELQEDRDRITRFVEESLRIYSPSHFRTRVAMVDTQVAGTAIEQGRSVVTLSASAGRDPAHYPDPEDIHFDRQAPRDHLAFGLSARQCVGAALARVVIQELIALLLRRFPDVELDADAEAPAFRGFLQRSFAPLNVRFSSSNGDASLGSQEAPQRRSL